MPWPDPREAGLQSTAEVALRSFRKPWPQNDVTQKQQDQQSRWWKRESKGFYPLRVNFYGDCPQGQKSMKKSIFWPWPIGSKGLWSQREKKQRRWPFDYTSLLLEDKFQAVVGEKNPNSLSWGGRGLKQGRLRVRLAGWSTEGRELGRELHGFAEDSPALWLDSHLHRGNTTQTVNWTTLHRIGGEHRKYSCKAVHRISGGILFEVKDRYYKPDNHPYSLGRFCPHTFLLFSPYSIVLIAGTLYSFMQTLKIR